MPNLSTRPHFYRFQMCAWCLCMLHCRGMYGTAPSKFGAFGASFRVSRSLCVCLFSTHVLSKMLKKSHIITPNTTAMAPPLFSEVCMVFVHVLYSGCIWYCIEHISSAQCQFSSHIARSLCVRCLYAVDVQNRSICAPKTTPTLFWSLFAVCACIRGMEASAPSKFRVLNASFVITKVTSCVFVSKNVLSEMPQICSYYQWTRNINHTSVHVMNINHTCTIIGACSLERRASFVC
jgi:hypothetical protein